MYQPGMTAKKAGTEGGWAAVLALVVTGALNSLGVELSPEAQAGVIGLAVAAVRAARNWWKHRGN